jgi:hypothetical protein
MIGNSHFDNLLAEIPASGGPQVQMDWQGYAQALSECSIEPSAVRCLSYCTHKVANIEANFGDYGLAALHPAGVMVSTGARSRVSKKLKLRTIDLARCQEFGPVEHSDPRNYGRFCIEFGGPGSVLLGRLEWNWTGKRFRDSSELIMDAAAERDRFLAQVESLLN